MKYYLSQKGMTLIELLVVVTIIGILVGMVAPKLIGRTDDAKRVAAKAQIRNFEGALKMYRLDNGFYPSTEQGLQALVEKSSSGDVSKGWREGGYIENSKIPLDPWKNPYVYISPGTYSQDYDIMSLGADNAVGGEGKYADIMSWDMQQ